MSRRQHAASLPMSRRRLLSSGLAVAAAVPALGRRAFGQSQQVNVLNWDTYIGETTLDEFTDATGIAVRYDLFASNDELFAKLRGGNPGYDVIFPTNDYVERMIAADMLLPLDHAKIPEHGEHRPGLRRPGVRPRPRAQHAVFLGHGRARLSQLRRQPDRIRRPVRERPVRRAHRAAQHRRHDPRHAQVSRPLAQQQGPGASRPGRRGADQEQVRRSSRSRRTPARIC